MRVAAPVLCAMVSWCWQTAAHAQSSVTLYGVIDSGLRFTNHGASYDATGKPASSGNTLSLPLGGGLSENYWGLKGREDLGGGLQAVFQVQSLFYPATDALAPAGSQALFQLAWVGLRSAQYGQLTLGRQYNVAFKATTLGFASNQWSGSQIPYSAAFKPEQIVLAGARTSNMLQYGAHFGDVYFFGQYALGNRSGAPVQGSQAGAGLAYAPTGGPVTASVAYMRSRDDVTSGTFDIFSGGGSLTLGSIRFNAGYLQDSRSNNFTSFADGPFTPTTLAGLGIISPAQVVNPSVPGGFDKRKMLLAGVTYTLTPEWTVAANGWWTKQTGYTDKYNGSAHQYQIITGYNLSKRSTVYAEVDYSRYGGGMIGAQFVGANALSPTASPSQLGAMIGIRHYL